MHLIFLVLLILLGCNSESNKKLSKEEIAKQKQEITLWMDSLLATESLFKLTPGFGATMQRKQERYFHTYNYTTSLQVELTKDSIGVKNDYRYHYNSSEEFREQVASYSERHQEYDPDSPLTLIIYIEKDAPLTNLSEVLSLFQGKGYKTVIFLGEFQKQHPVPSLPDTSYFNKLYSITNKAPAAMRATVFAEFVSKKFRIYPEANKLFDAIAYAAPENRIKDLCRGLQDILTDKRDYKTFLTICYALMDHSPNRKRVQAGGKAFYIHPTKEILEATTGVWSDISDSIFALDADTLMVK